MLEGVEVVSANLIRTKIGRYGTLYSVNPETGALSRVDIDRSAPEAGMVQPL